MRRRALLVIGGLLLFIGLAGMEWFWVTGRQTASAPLPVQPGQKLPTFAATFADGRAFTQETLQDGTARVLIFFRGQW